MDANVPVKCQNPDCSAPSASPNNLDASPDDWKAFPWHKFPGFSISERVSRRTSSKVTDFSAVGTQNIEKYLFKEYRLINESGRRRPPAL
ncbi:hypothetical protein HZ326_26454 [Fusarium oxysporum f. sp. albedinis]|nr:hypothetical protein HZ326_26454 [Fusarium oxysporum f. sp. albedinis]